MKKKSVQLMFLVGVSCLLLSGCKSKEPEKPDDDVLTAIIMADLQPGHFYVKSGESFYLLPVEDQNYDIAKEIKTTDDSLNGMVKQEDNRLVDFVHKDLAIPTLYKNDQLIYISSGSISSFTWERYKDYGYSIGLSGLKLSDSGKVKSYELTMAASGSSVEAAVAGITIPEGADITVDKINGTDITSQYLNDGGIITGMSRDAAANVDFYVGTQHIPVTVSADTRYFKSFELYTTDKYSLSTDGYAIVEIPAYFKSGYYLINGIGFVKYLNVDRGVDESGIALDTAYYYIGKEGKTLTFYEWQEENGLLPTGGQDAIASQAETIDLNEFPERYQITTDSTQSSINISIAYRYTSNEYRLEASKNGKFPKVYLMQPSGSTVTLSEDQSRTYDQDNKKEYIYLTAQVETPVAGDYFLLYKNFENIEKVVSVDINSGNATSYLHNSSSGTIDIYYDGSESAHDITVTWENSDHAAKDIKITAPDGSIYSKEQTPGNIMADEYGRFVVKLPNLAEGNYHFEIKGDDLGRVWVDCIQSVSFDQTQVTIPDETNAEPKLPETSETSEAENQAS